MNALKQHFVNWSGRSRTVVVLRWAAWCIVMLVAVVFAPATPAVAHTDLLQSSPGLNQTIGGDIKFLDLAFSEPVSNFKLSITDPSGVEVPGHVVVDQGSVVSFGFDEPLADEGRYVVDYNMTSFDLDFTEREFVFSYEQSAPQPFRIGSDGRFIAEPAGTNWLSLVSTLLLVVSAVGIAVLLLHRQGFFTSSRVVGETGVDDKRSTAGDELEEANSTPEDGDSDG